MQQTETSKLNLVETSDDFSPKPLNFNTEKLSDILAVTDFGARAALDAHRALDARVTALEAKKMVVGSYEGTGKTRIIELGFTPIAVMLHIAASNQGYRSALIVAGHTAYDSSGNPLTIVEGGFQLETARSPQLNQTSSSCYYIAFG